MTRLARLLVHSATANVISSKVMWIEGHNLLMRYTPCTLYMAIVCCEYVSGQPRPPFNVKHLKVQPG